MTRSEAVAKVQRILGFRSDRTTEIIEALQESQRELERGRTLPWFLRQQDEPLTATAGNPSVALPERWLREVEDEPIYWLASVTDLNGPYIPLDKVNYNEARSYWQSRGVLAGSDAAPQQYALRADTIYIFPTPSVDVSFTWTYFKGAPLLDTDIQNSWLMHYPDLLVGRAAELVGQDLRDPTAVAKGQALYARWAQVMVNVEAEREMGGNPIAMGEFN